MIGFVGTDIIIDVLIISRKCTCSTPTVSAVTSYVLCWMH